MTDADGATDFNLTVADEAAGRRLDRFLADAVGVLSRSRIQALIQAGHVSGHQGEETDPARKVKAGEVFCLTVPPVAAAKPKGQDIPLKVVFEDDQVIVVDKPAGLVVHPAAGNPDGTLVNALIRHCGTSLSGIGGEARPGIVHRIDKDTSGLMVVAKTDLAHQALSKQFAAHSLERAYQALVWGLPSPMSGEIDTLIGRHPVNRKKMAVVKRGGKQAITGYRVLKSYAFGAVSLVECRLKTGRTHQIRVHMAHLGHPLLGDPVYGRPDKRRKGLPADLQQALSGFKRQALHATVIGFFHPISGDKIYFESNLSNDINEIQKKLELI